MKLKQIEVNAFAGINPQSPVVLDFTKSKFILSSGDKGVGKTSLLNSLLVACGQLSHTGKDGKNFVNTDTDKIDINFEFVGNDRCNYVVRCTKSNFTLTYDGVAQAEPISKMKELLGVVGVSPMAIKDKPLKDIVKWLSSYSNKSAEEFEAQMNKLKVAIKTSEGVRADSNKQLKALTEYLNAEPMFVNWEESETKYKEPVKIEVLSAKLKKAGDESDKVIKAEEGLKYLKQNRQPIVDKIEALKKELEAKELELVNHDTRIVAGEKFVEENKGVKKNYDAVKLEYDNAHNTLIAYNQ